MRRLWSWLAVGAAGALVVIAWLAAPQRLADDAIAAPGSGNATRGARIFALGGCASCHAAAGAKGEARHALGGGAALVTPFGSFRAPNISPDPRHGIGAWSLADFANAMQRGVSPDGRHYYPAFPYASYARMTKGDVADLFSYLRTLPKVAAPSATSGVAFPYSIRSGIGLWKRLFLTSAPAVTLPASASPPARAGQYLVEGPGHCGECHTPRTLGGLGRLDTSRWLAGAADPEGRGKVPRLAGIGWSAEEIADYLETGFTPDYDAVGGSMADVQRNMAQLPAGDRAAMAAYIKALPPQ
ncbi:cytochrome c [Sandarakinorhabdus sp.]|uniref:c-type cytochrome n=1 Tax=Sandarakinorhabdus sp. TaxID=1916663 RepID=UPI00286E33D8|nr:cytochrome c [Sandarakinorhabdus sp.]